LNWIAASLSLLAMGYEIIGGALSELMTNPGGGGAPLA
jgi:hypothetical protein